MGFLMCSFSRVKISISNFYSKLPLSLPVSLVPSAFPLLSSLFPDSFLEVSGMRVAVNSSFVSPCELSCCEEHELSSEECWKHLPVWAVYMRKSWDEIQRLYVGRSLKIMFCGGGVADGHPSPSCTFTLQPPSFCSQ